MNTPYMVVEGPANERFRVSSRLLRAILNADQFLTEAESSALRRRSAHEKQKPAPVPVIQPNVAEDDHPRNEERDISTESSDENSCDDDESVVNPVPLVTKSCSKKRKAALKNTKIFSLSPPAKRLNVRATRCSPRRVSDLGADDVAAAASAESDIRAPKDGHWESKYQQLELFHQKYGHCRVPRRNNKKILYAGQLERWVRSQREEMKKLDRGLNSRMTPDRMEKLDSLDFVWDGTRKGK